MSDVNTFSAHFQHNGGGPLPIQPVHAPLHVITSISNPQRYRSRYHLYRRFEQYMRDSGVILHTVEQAFGHREFEIIDRSNVNHIPLRSEHELWHKENMLNIALQRLPSEWEYVAWIDADVEFARPDWAYETLHLLQHYDVIQMFSQAVDLAPDYRILGGHRDGWISSWINSGHEIPVSAYSYSGYGAGNNHPGYAWAAKRSALNALGGLIDWSIGGSADWHMAAALIGHVEISLNPVESACPVYAQWCHDWQDRADEYIKGNVGFMPGLIYHHWHGKKSNRGYTDRWRILTENQFNPQTDIKRDTQGLWQLSGNKPELRDDLRRYLQSRNEDSIDE